MFAKNILSLGIFINLVLFSCLLLNTEQIPTPITDPSERNLSHLSTTYEGKEVVLNSLIISSPYKNKTIKTPSNNYDPTQLSINIPLSVEYPDATTDTITFVACKENNNCFTNGLWVGESFSDTVSIPGNGSLDISPFLSGTNLTQNISLYGLINAEIVSPGPIPSFSYQDTTYPDEMVQITLGEISPNTDNDGNGVPDNLTTTLLAGEMWSANRFVNNALRTVNIVNIDIAGNYVPIVAKNSIEIEVPTLEKLKADGYISSEINHAYAVVVLSDEISALIDNVIDDTGTETLLSWSETAVKKSPGNLNLWNTFLGITLIAVDNNQQIQPLHLNPQQNSIKVKLKNVQKPSLGNVEAFSYPFTMTETYFTNDPERVPIWKRINSEMSDNQLLFQVDESSIIALFDVGLTLNEVSPNIIPKGMATALTFKGVFPVSTALNIQQATELYEVKIGGQVSAFREGLPDYKNIAITAYKKTGYNQMFLTSPSLNTTGPVDVEIRHKKVENLSFLFRGALSVSNVYKVTATIERGPNTNSDDAEVILSPAQNPILPEKGSFLEGDTVSISIKNIDEQDQFDGWYSNEGTLLSRLPEFITRVNSDLNVKARIVRREFTITVNIDPPGNGIVILNPDGYRYAPGTEVQITAQPVQGFKFSQWVLPDDKTSTENPLVITINSNYEITAKFETGPAEVIGVSKLAGDRFETDSNGKERLVVWAIGGVVRRIEGLNLDLETQLQLVDATTGKDIGTPFKGINVASDKKYLDIIVPPYPLYSDTMPTYVDVDLKTGDSTIPAFRYYHYSKDGFGIYTTAFITDFSKTENITLFLETEKQGILQLPALSTTPTPVYGIFRAVKLRNEPTPTAIASAIGNTAICGGMFGNPIENAYEVACYLYQPTIFETPPPPGTAIYSPPKDGKGKLLFRNPVFPYNLDGTEKTDIPVIKITLPTNGLDYSYFKSGMAVFGQSSDYDYVKNQVIPGNITAFQSQILSEDLDPVMTDNSAGPTNKITMRVYNLNGFGIRFQSLLPFEVAGLVRLATENGVASSKTIGKSDIQIVSPKGGLAYIDHIELRNDEKKISASVQPESDPGKSEGLLEFKTPPIKQSVIVDVLIYLKGQPYVPAIILDNVIEYKKAPIILDTWILIPLGFFLAVFGIIGIGDDESPCFIATAAYGTPMAEEINVLRALRDQYMLTNPVGTAFVDVYYNVSPPLAHWLAQHPFFALLTRCILTPIVILSKVALLYPKTFLIILSLITLCPFICLKTSILRRKRQI